MTEDNVRALFMGLIGDLRYYPDTERLAYIDGALDMANAVLQKITKLEDKLGED